MRSDGIKGSAISRGRVARMVWLTAHPDLLEGVPSDSEDVDDAGRAKLLTLGTEMVRLGLYSSRTLRSDRNDGLRRLVGEIRRRR